MLLPKRSAEKPPIISVQSPLSQSKLHDTPPHINPNDSGPELPPLVGKSTQNLVGSFASSQMFKGLMLSSTGRLDGTPSLSTSSFNPSPSTCSKQPRSAESHLNPLISAESQSISHLLDATLLEFIKAFDYMDAPIKKLNSNEELRNEADLLKAVSIPTLPNELIPPVSSRRPSMISQIVDSNHSCTHENNLRKKLICSLNQLEPLNGETHLSKTAVDIASSFAGMNQTTFDLPQESNSESSTISNTNQKEKQQKMGIILSDCEKKISTLHHIRDDMLESKHRAENDERERLAEAYKGFDAKYQASATPLSNTVLKFNNETFRNNGLISFSADVEIEHDKQTHTQRYQKNQKPIRQIRRYSFPRTDTKLNRFLFAEQKNQLLELDAVDVLEVDYEPDDWRTSKANTKEQSFTERAKKHQASIASITEETKIRNRMNNRIYYLSNPRFPVKQPFKKNTIKQFLIPSISHNQDSGLTSCTPIIKTPKHLHSTCGIIAEPATIYFSDYTPYCRYDKVLTIRNTSHVAHRFRVSTGTPYHYSQFFSFKLTHCPLDNNGLVAPGLSCEYTISFTPNSYADFSQSLCISTEMGNSFTVDMVAKRQPPELTLPKILDCGPCRAGFFTLRQWDFINKGGPARFQIMSPGEDLDPFVVFDKIGAGNHLTPETIRVGPFEISPSYFSLGSGESSKISVSYSPSDTQMINQDRTCLNAHENVLRRIDSTLLRVACDNCQVIELPLSGIAEQPRVEIVRIEQYANQVTTHANLPHNSQFDLIHNFGDQNPHGISSLIIVVRNLTPLLLSFRWAQSDNIRNKSFELVKHITPSSSFSIRNSKGWLEPNAETAFTIEFSPEAIRSFDVVAELILLMDPNSRESHENIPGMLGDIDEQSLLTLRLLGNGIPYNAQLDTHLLHIPKVLLSGESYSTKIRLTNHSVWKLPFEWMLEGIDEKSMNVEVSELNGTVEPQACQYIKVVFTGGFPSTVNGALVCNTAHGMGPLLRISLKAIVELPSRSLAFDVDVVDFGLLALGEKKSMSIPLVNSTSMSMMYDFMAMKRTGKNQPIDSYLIYKPSKGIISPYSTQVIELSYIPTWYQILQGLLECRIHAIWIKGQEPISPTLDEINSLPCTVASAVEIISTVQTPCIKILYPQFQFSCFCNVPLSIQLDLKNQTMLPAKFELHSFSNDIFMATFTPSVGKLAGGESIEIQIKIIFHVVGSYTLLKLFGNVEGMVENHGELCMSMNVDVKPLKVSFQVPENEKAMNARAVMLHPETGKRHAMRSSNLRFDFGTTCPIFATRARTLIIRNHSAMVSPFKIGFDKYTTIAQVDTLIENLADAPLDDLQEEIANKEPFLNGQASSAPLLLRSTKAQKIGFSSKSGQGYIDNIKKVRQIIQRMQILLADGRGAAFHASPNQGVIQPWGEVQVRITSYNNLVGLYEDYLWCEIGNWVKQRMPVRLGVFGTPVKFTGPHLVAKKRKDDKETERVNFGSRIINPGWCGGDGVRIGLPASHKPETPLQSQAMRVSSLSSGLTKDPNMLTAFTKSILVENQSPRDIILKWKVYIRHSNLHEHSSDNMDALEVDHVITDRYLVHDGEMGILEVSPNVLTIPAFKAAPLTCLYRSAMLGTFDALVVADIGYIESNGSVRYAPRRYAKHPSNGDLEPGNSITIQQLDTVAKLHIQARCIEPKLSLDGGNRIRIKQTPRPTSTDGEPITSDSVIAFLKNNSDAVCDFTLEAIPAHLFSVTASNRFLKQEDLPDRCKPSKGIHSCKNKKCSAGESKMYELKQTQQLMITVKYFGLLEKLSDLPQPTNPIIQVQHCNFVLPIAAAESDVSVTPALNDAALMDCEKVERIETPSSQSQQVTALPASKSAAFFKLYGQNKSVFKSSKSVSIIEPGEAQATTSKPTEYAFIDHSIATSNTLQIEPASFKARHGSEQLDGSNLPLIQCIAPPSPTTQSIDTSDNQTVQIPCAAADIQTERSVDSANSLFSKVVDPLIESRIESYPTDNLIPLQECSILYDTENDSTLSSQSNLIKPDESLAVLNKASFINPDTALDHSVIQRQFRIIAMGEIRITFSNNMVQNIPIVVEKSF
ncbi:hypothetical protein BDV3_001641 [Batrachochytrium dendrobatidis]